MLLTTKQVANFLNLSTVTIRRMARNNEIPGAVDIRSQDSSKSSWNFDSKLFNPWFKEFKKTNNLSKKKKSNLNDIEKSLSSIEKKLDYLCNIWK